jgi:hypothetical protein
VPRPERSVQTGDLHAAFQFDGAPTQAACQPLGRLVADIQDAAFAVERDQPVLGVFRRFFQTGFEQTQMFGFGLLGEGPFDLARGDHGQRQDLRAEAILTRGCDQIGCNCSAALTASAP